MLDIGEERAVKLSAVNETAYMFAYADGTITVPKDKMYGTSLLSQCDTVTLRRVRANAYVIGGA